MSVSRFTAKATRIRPNRDNLAVGYPAAVKGMLNIGLLHTALTGREEHEPYAPCSLEDLLTRNYDYWALGHVHQRESVQSADHPRVELPGNVQGRHIRETGAKGCLLASANGQGRVSTEFRPLDVVRWNRIRVNCDGAPDRDEIFRRVQRGFRRRRRGRRRPNVGGSRRTLRAVCPARCALSPKSASFATSCWLSRGTLAKMRFGSKRSRFARHSRRPRSRDEIGDDALSEIAAVVADLANHSEHLQAIFDSDEIKALASKLPAELRNGAEAVLFGDPNWSRSLLNRAARCSFKKRYGRRPADEVPFARLPALASSMR